VRAGIRLSDITFARPPKWFDLDIQVTADLPLNGIVRVSLDIKHTVNPCGVACRHRSAGPACACCRYVSINEGQPALTLEGPTAHGPPACGQPRSAEDPIMPTHELQQPVEELWEQRDELSPSTGGAARRLVEAALDALDAGVVRVAEPTDPGWRVNQWLKKAVLLSFRLTDSIPMSGPGGAPVFDKVPMKFAGWGENRFREAGFRAVPGAVVRRSAYIAPGVVLMPSFVNAGAYVDRNTMVDTWATVGSCAQIGKNCHLSGGVGIGGVLEPLQANPVVIEDDCFIGARSEVAEGVVVERGSVLSMGVFIGASTKVIDRATGEVHIGRVPAYSVVVPGSLPGRALPDGSPGPGLYCAVIVKRVDAQTRAKTSINELLRE
jgi:2,3,4,5-tetrahydropyridine-2,6-dicarboxylate N-succinyltransferase